MVLQETYRSVMEDGGLLLKQEILFFQGCRSVLRVPRRFHGRYRVRVRRVRVHVGISQGCVVSRRDYGERKEKKGGEVQEGWFRFQGYMTSGLVYDSF